MKKLFCFLVSLSIVTTSVQAQKDGAGGMQWGLKLGPNFGSMSGEGAEAESSIGEKKKMKLGLHGGVFVIIPITNMLYFQPELLYSGQGVIFEISDEKYTTSTNHLNVPLNLRLQTAGGFYLVFGPQVGFAMGGKVKTEIMGQETEQDIDDELRGFNFYGLIGAGFKSSSGFGLYARYARSFSKVFDFEGEDDPKVYYSTLSLSLFYLLGGTK